MKLLGFFFFFFFILFIAFHATGVDGVGQVTKTIVVGKSGAVNYGTINEAIAAIPSGNNQWTRIKINAGVYREKVYIPKDKRFILMEGDGDQLTSIEWGDYMQGSTVKTATFTSAANDTVFKGITFKNTFDGSKHHVQAVAALVSGDRVSFYGCSFIGFQDTLSDLVGRHYFNGCKIQGIVDFIFGFGQSIYENCELRTVGNLSGPGSVTAQGRYERSDTNGYGFVFKSCNISGSAKTYLGRAWRPYSRVVFYRTYMSNVVVPKGWDNWNKAVKFLTYAESECTGPGANLEGRVPWQKKLTAAELNQFTDISFIDAEGWLSQQPT